MTDEETPMRPVRKKPERCDNHPDRNAVLNTDGGGVFQTIHLCQQCVPRSLRIGAGR